MNATSPSFASSLPMARAMASAERRQPVSSSSVMAAITTWRVARTATGALASMRAARSRALSMRFARLAEDVDQAEVVGAGASIGSPVSAISMATLNGSFRGNRNSPPAAATRLRLTSGTPKRGGRGRHDEVARQGDLGPPGQGRPVNGGHDRFGALRRVMPPKPPRGVDRDAMRPALISLRSAPAQNTGGTPVRIPTHRESSASRRSTASSMPLATSAVHGVAGVRAVDGDEGPVALGRVLDGRHGGSGYLGCRRVAPSRRMVSPFM